jgi:hypothetical protein
MNSATRPAVMIATNIKDEVNFQRRELRIRAVVPSNPVYPVHPC